MWPLPEESAGGWGVETLLGVWRPECVGEGGTAEGCELTFSAANSQLAAWEEQMS